MHSLWNTEAAEMRTTKTFGKHGWFEFYSDVKPYGVSFSFEICLNRYPSNKGKWDFFINIEFYKLRIGGQVVW